MAKRVYEEKNIAATAAKIRELIGNDTQYTSYDLADGVEEVFEAGHQAGYQAQIEEIEEIVAAALEKYKEVVNITSIDEPYETFEDLPETAPNGTHLLVNAEKAIYSFDTNTGTWENKTNLKAHTAYVVLSGEKSGIYRYTMAEPYLISAEENAFGKAKKYADENTVPRMSVNDEADGNNAVEDYRNGKTFPDTYNRVYVEMSEGRGVGSRYCLTASPVAPKDPDPEDYANGNTLDSIPMRMKDGFVRAPICVYGETQPSVIGGYNEEERMMSKKYIDSGIESRAQKLLNSSTENRVYVERSENRGPTLIPLMNGPTASSDNIPQRSKDGIMRCNTPEGSANYVCANVGFVKSELAKFVGSAPESLNALNELAAALGNDPNFATTVANQIGAKASKTELQETESAILDGLSAILAAQEEILGGSV